MNRDIMTKFIVSKNLTLEYLITFKFPAVHKELSDRQSPTFHVHNV